MSRHRGVRNMGYDDYDDEEEDYGLSCSGSYGENSLSTSMEQEFIYRRDCGNTPKMSQFFFEKSPSDEPKSEDPVVAEPEALPSMNPEQAQKLSEAMDQILEVVGLDTIPEALIKESIIKCDFDATLALNTILNNPPTHNTEAARRRRVARHTKDEEPSSRDTPGCNTSSYHSSSQPIGIRNPNREKSRRMEITTVERLDSPPKEQPSIQNLRKFETLTINEEKPRRMIITTVDDEEDTNVPTPRRDPSPKDRASPQPPAVVTTPLNKTTTMRKASVNVLQEFKKCRKNNKEYMNMVVTGHVDSGKSTLMGHLLVNLGVVSSRAMHKYETESRKVGKQSFCYAWVLDETSEERNRGITMDVGQGKFITDTKIINLLDAPGHKDFIPNMISGAYQADVAILVINATTGEFEAGFDAGGQTREHGLLVRSLGVSQIIVAVNKLDTVEWREDRFKQIKQKLDGFLKQVGFKSEDVSYVPCSGYTGDNLTSPPSKECGLSSWSFKPKTLLEAIDSFRPPVRLVEKPFRMSISDIFKPEQSSGLSIAGRIESGYVRRDDKILICPLNEVGVVKGISTSDSDNDPEGKFAGDVVTLIISGIMDHAATVTPGMVLCDPQFPVPCTKTFRARIVIFNPEVPVTKGFPVVLHYGCVQVQAVIKKLLAEINKSTGEVSRKKPRCLSKNCNASVEIVAEVPICLELYSNIKELGRFMLRNNGKTIAAGLVTDIL